MICFENESLFQKFCYRFGNFLNLSIVSWRSISDTAWGIFEKDNLTKQMENLTIHEILVIPRKLKNMNFLPKRFSFEEFQMWNLELCFFFKNSSVSYFIWMLQNSKSV